MFKEMVQWRAGIAWIRGCPVAYERGVIMDASVATRRGYEDRSDNIPYRRDDGRITSSSANPPIRYDADTVRIPEYGNIHTITSVDDTWACAHSRL